MYKHDTTIPQDLQDNWAFLDYYYRLKSLACTMFEWRGLPDSVSSRVLEERLYSDGYALFFSDSALGWLALGGSYSGVNVNGDPINCQPLSPAKTFQKLAVIRDGEDNYTNKACFVRNNFDCFPTYITTLRYAKALYSLDMTRDINLKAQKTPVLILCDQKGRTTMENVYAKYTGDAPVIYADKNILDPNCVKVLKTDAPFIAGQLQDIKVAIYNEYLNILGIAKANDSKKERLITDEVEQDNKEASAFANTMLASRLTAANIISKMTGKNVTVTLRAEAETSSPKYEKSVTSVNYNYGENKNNE